MVGSIFGHQNILVIFKKDNKIHISVYDPHGTNDVKKIHAVSEKFLTRIRNIYPDTIVISPRVTVSCPIGLQRYAKDRFGWCMIFSLFWLYCVLYISSKTDNGVTMDNIYLVEKIILKYAKSPELLYSMTIKFAIYLINSYLELVKNTDPEYNKILSNTIETIIGDTDNIKETPYKKPKSESTVKERTVYLKQVTKSGSRKSNRKQDGSDCENDVDCLSDICKSNKCISYSDAYDTKKRKK